MRFAGRRVFVTGGATRIRCVTSEYLASEGARIFVVGGLTERKREPFMWAPRTFCFRGPDLAEESMVASAVSETVGKLGGLDAVVNCAGHSSDGEAP